MGADRAAAAGSGPEMGPAGTGAGAQVFVADVDDPVVAHDDVHHLTRVLRLRPGEPVVAGDGAGRWRLCTFMGTTERGIRAGRLLEPDGPVRASPPPAPAVTVAFVPVKGGRPDWAVQKLTEVGVDHIVLLRSRRAVVRWDGERERHALDRLRRVARLAAAQSRRAWLPDVAGVTALEELSRRLSPAPLAFADPGGDHPGASTSAVAIGPEGGWEPAETAGRPLVRLGPRVLRAETATVAAGLLLCALRDGLVAPAGGGGGTITGRAGERFLQSPR